MDFLQCQFVVGNTGIEPVVTESADLQSTASPLMLLPHTISFADALFAHLNSFTRVYCLLNKLRRVDVYPMAYISKTNGTRYQNRTGLPAVKGQCPKPIDEPSMVIEFYLGKTPSENRIMPYASDLT